MDCGNIEKFIGNVHESGLAYIYQDLNAKNNDTLSWIYLLSDKKWSYTSRPYRCYYCGSKNIRKLKAS